MAKRKKASEEEIYDSFNCSVDSWRRDYSFGIRRFQIPGMETDKPYREMDHLVITGTVVSRDTNRKSNRRTFRKVELNLFPVHFPRDEWRKDMKAVGRVWTERGRKETLIGTVHVAADVFHSLIPCLAINHFRELRLRVLNLHRAEGDIDDFELDQERMSEKSFD